MHEHEGLPRESRAEVSFITMGPNATFSYERYKTLYTLETRKSPKAPPCLHFAELPYITMGCTSREP